MSLNVANSMGYIGEGKTFSSIEAQFISSLSGGARDLTIDGQTSSIIIQTSESVADAILLNPSGALGGIQLTGPTEVVNQDPFRRSSGRYYLEEFFGKLPQINLNSDFVANQSFELLGTNVADTDVTYSATIAAIQLETAGANNDQVIVVPHLDALQSAWAVATRWGSENAVEFECAVRTDASIDDVTLWAGLKVTNVPAIATDADQVFFRYDGADTFWHCISSIGGTDTDTTTTVVAAATTTFRFRVSIDAARFARFYIDDVLVFTTLTALTDDINFVPYVGVQATAGAVKRLHLAYEKISRVLFE